MKLQSFICFLLCLSFHLFAFSEEKTEDLEAKQIALAAQIIKNSNHSKMEEVWPNYNLQTSPVFITFGNGHIYAFNFKSNDSAWNKTILNGQEILYTKNDKWGINNAPMQFGFEIENQSAFVYRLDLMKDTPFMPFFVLVHERFHVYQIQNFASEQIFENNEYPESQNVENLSLMQLEELLLLDFLKALDQNNQIKVVETLKTYISINKERQKLILPSSQKWENRQQMVEGLADYVAAKNLDVFAYFGKKVGQTHLLRVMEQYTKDENITERAIKWRHYGVGSSLGYALDYLQVKDWKKDVEENISLQSLLEKNLFVSENESKILFRQAIEKYDLKNLQNKIESKVTAYNSMISSHLNHFDTDPGLMVHIQSPIGSGLSAGGYSKGMYSLQDGNMLTVLDTSKTSSPDNRWCLELKSVPQLLQTSDGFRHFRTDVEKLIVEIDGKEQRLDQLTETVFNRIDLKGENCTFKSFDCKGRIVKKGQGLIISFE